MSSKKYNSFLLLFLYISILNAQIAPQVFTISDINNVSVEKLDTDASGNLLFAGLFDETLELEGFEIQTQGETDIYIGQRETENILWLQSFGSTGQDQILALTSDIQNNIYVAGSYLNEITFGMINLTPATGVRGLFIAKISPLGVIIWVRDVNSSGEQVITDLVVDDALQLYACGYFGGTFSMDTIEANAVAENDAMVLQFSENGILQQFYHAGISGNIRPQALSLNATNDQINISGIYKGVVNFDGNTIQTNTNDFDIFVLQLNTNFNVQWSKKAGGVFEENNAQILTDEAGNIYVIGDFQGVIKLSETIEITTNGIQDNNLYILKYTQNGVPLWGRSLGGTNFDFVTDATWSSTNQIAVTGSFQTDIKMDDFTLTALENFDTYTVGISSEDGAVEWLEGLHGNDFVIGNTITFADNQLVTGGSFNNSIFYQNEQIESLGFFDGFIQYFDPVLTSTKTVYASMNSSIYPNPTSDFIYIKTEETDYQIELFSLTGELLKREMNASLVDLQLIPNGIYMLHFKDNKGNVHCHKIIVQKI